MKLGVFTVLYRDQPLDSVLERLAKLGVEAVELGTGNYPGSTHCDPDTLLGDANARRRLLGKLEARGMVISALSCHGNPLHPDERIAASTNEVWRKTVRLAAELGVPVVNTFSGCPGDRTSQMPNWVTCAWPPEFAELLDWQWNERIVPYWQAESDFATATGVEQIGLELHPGFAVYNPETLRRLRDAVGPSICANFDPSHLIWQGIDPLVAIRDLGAAICHAHAKDVYLDEGNIARNGVLDTKHYKQVRDRAWTFRSIGFGHGELFWRNIVSSLRTAGYDHVLSLEHEDPLMSTDEGLTKAIEVLDRILIRESPGPMWWA